MTFSAKKDGTYALAIWSPVILTGALFVYYATLSLAIIFLFSVGLSTWIWFSTRYEIREGKLIAKSWLFQEIMEIERIVSIKPVRNLAASFALARDRLEITDNSGNTIYVSPEQPEAFIQEIQRYNPGIKVPPAANPGSESLEKA